MEDGHLRGLALGSTGTASLVEGGAQLQDEAML